MAECSIRLSVSKPFLLVSEEPYLDVIWISGRMEPPRTIDIMLTLRHAAGVDGLLLDFVDGAARAPYGFEPGMLPGTVICDRAESAVEDGLVITLPPLFFEVCYD